jgi:hypothetical protein
VLNCSERLTRGKKPTPPAVALIDTGRSVPALVIDAVERGVEDVGIGDEGFARLEGLGGVAMVQNQSSEGEVAVLGISVCGRGTAY